MFLVWLARLIAPHLPERLSLVMLEWSQRRFLQVSEHFIVHKLKTQWIYSGVRQDEKGFFSDIGIVRSTRKLNRAQALREYQTMFPKGVIKHIDDANKIITYAVSA